MFSQQQLVQAYRRRYPKHTFKDISYLTGINKTRIFRIFNGQEMKLSEYNAIDELIKKNALQKMVFRCSKVLPEAKLEKLHSVLERHLDSYLLTHDVNAFYASQSSNRRMG